MKVRITHAEIAGAYEELFAELRRRPYSRENDKLEHAVRDVFFALDGLICVEDNMQQSAPPLSVEINVPAAIDDLPSDI